MFSRNKAETCKQIKAEVFVDNDLSTCIKVKNAGISTFHFGKENSEGIATMQDLNDLLKLTNK